MSMPKEVQETAELYKAKVTNCPSVSDEYKRCILKVLNIASMATNGISPEEKIQKLTEAIYFLGIAQVTSMVDVTQLIHSINKKQCGDCIALKHAKDVIRKEEQQAIIDAYKAAHGIVDDGDKKEEEMSWTAILKTIVLKPYIYIITFLMIVSPYGVDIVKAILNFCSK